MQKKANPTAKKAGLTKPLASAESKHVHGGATGTTDKGTCDAVGGTWKGSADGKGLGKCTY